jgi:molybdopterin-guanine dinucleotide biosynthesis protein A
MPAAGTLHRESVSGVVLAGGAARRMGGADKGLIRLHGRPLVEYALDGLRPQVGFLCINANRNLDRYRNYGVPVIVDERSGYEGPLAGMASALRVVRTEYLVTAPCDSPFVPADLVQRLARAMHAAGAEIGVAHDGVRMQPVFCLLRTRLLGALLAYLERGERKIDRWFSEQCTAMADFSDVPDAFLNINTPEDVRHMEARMTQEPARAAR